MDFENMNIWCWLIPILIGVICGILGYLMGKGSDTTIDNSVELKSLREKNGRLQSDLEACNKKLSAKPSGTTGASGTTSASGGSGDVSSSLGATSTSGTSSAPEPAAAPTTLAFDAAAAKTAFGKSIEKDDLKIIEGIGPKIEGMFHEAGIKTWKVLSETAVAGCQEVLNKGGERYRVHDPASWPMQAKMCYEGKWKELVKWQDEHDHGKL
jgi:predicted flap endonuclease-1-like 5' DNA nuclease